MHKFKIRLSNTQLKQLAEYMANLSIVMLGAILTQLFSPVDKLNIPMILSILIGSGSCLAMSLYLLKGRR